MADTPQGNTNGAPAVDTPAAPAIPAVVDPATPGADSTVLTGDTPKPDESTVLTDVKPEDKPPVAEQAPEKYEDFKMPEGITLAPEFNAKFSELAKGLNLTQDSAQKLVDLANEQTSQLATKQLEAWTEMKTSWRADIEKDPEFGGAKMPETKIRAQRALKDFGSPELTEFLNQGYGNHPAIIKLLAKVDQSRGAAPTDIGGNPPSKADVTIAEALYGKNTA